MNDFQYFLIEFNIFMFLQMHNTITNLGGSFFLMNGLSYIKGQRTPEKQPPSPTSCTFSASGFVLLANKKTHKSSS